MNKEEHACKNSVRLVLWATFFMSTVLGSQVYATEAFFYKEASLIGGYSEEDGWVAENQPLRNSLGFEYYRKYSNDHGDFLTLDVQTRIAYSSSEKAREAFAAEIHDAWLEYKLALGKNVRIGHFAPAYGLEPITDTHGTLIQTLAMKDIGFKKDWGVASRGFLGPIDYDTSFQIGSGMGIRQLGENYLLTLRVGTPRGGDLSYGASLLWGEILESKQMRTIPHPKLVSNQSIRKKRMGVDAQYQYGPYLLKSEVSFGQNRDREVLGLLGEIDYLVPQNENLEFQLQGNAFFSDLGDTGKVNAELVTGVSYQLTQFLKFRIVYFGDLHAEEERDHRVMAQLYFFSR